MLQKFKVTARVVIKARKTDGAVLRLSLRVESSLNGSWISSLGGHLSQCTLMELSLLPAEDAGSNVTWRSSPPESGCRKTLETSGP